MEQYELLIACRDSGQMSAAQVYAHHIAGDFNPPNDDADDQDGE